MTEDEKRKKSAALAAEIMRLSQNSVLLNLRFMSPAVMRLAFTPSETTFRVDGRNIFYGDEFVLGRYLAGKNQVARDVLHMIIHCVFRHAFVGGVDPVLWNLSCDISAEHTISSLGLACFQTEFAGAQKDALKILEGELKSFNAETLYRYFKNKNLTLEEASKLHTLFMCDDHRLWYNDGTPPEEDEKNGEESSGKNDNGNTPSPGDGKSEDTADDGGNSPEEGAAGGESTDEYASQSGTNSELEKEWEEISRSIQMDLETFSKEKVKRRVIWLCA